MAKIPFRGFTTAFTLQDVKKPLHIKVMSCDLVEHGPAALHQVATYCFTGQRLECFRKNVLPGSSFVFEREWSTGAAAPASLSPPPAEG
ncbi:hypothetical protein [Thermincola potens]|uniref:hypothetical protein n=1 Tax=Thermincola potens TaxID=863643 RepID=UPI0005A2CD3C|nr:hypothetical protein [Thermincola potens]